MSDTAPLIMAQARERWKTWEAGPVEFGTVLDRIIDVLGSVREDVRAKISAAMNEANFQVVMTVPKGTKREVGATIEMTIPTKDDIPVGLFLIMRLLGYPHVLWTSMTPLAWDRIRTFWEFGAAPPTHGELRIQSGTKVA